MIEALAGTLAYVVERLRSCHRSGYGRRHDGAGRWPGVERSDVGDASVPGDQAVGLCAHGRQHPPDWFGDGERGNAGRRRDAAGQGEFCGHDGGHAPASVSRLVDLSLIHI